MQAKILARQANLTASTMRAGAPPEQDIPLKVPQKTTLFVELTQRERDHSMGKYFEPDCLGLFNALFALRYAPAVLERFVPYAPEDCLDILGPAGRRPRAHVIRPGRQRQTIGWL